MAFVCWPYQSRFVGQSSSQSVLLFPWNSLWNWADRSLISEGRFRASNLSRLHIWYLHTRYFVHFLCCCVLRHSVTQMRVNLKVPSSRTRYQLLRYTFWRSRRKFRVRERRKITTGRNSQEIQSLQDLSINPLTAEQIWQNSSKKFLPVSVDKLVGYLVLL